MATYPFVLCFLRLVCQETKLPNLCFKFMERAPAVLPITKIKHLPVLRLLDGVRELRVHSGIDRAIRFYFIMHLVMHQGAGVFVRECLTLAIGAL